MALRWPQALAWRMRQQLLDPLGAEPAEDVVRRLGGVPAQSESAAEHAIRARQARSRPGELTQALAEGRLLRTYAFRGAIHLLTPEEGGVFLALRAASRMWELPSWQDYYELTPSDWPRLREVVREALTNGPLTRKELGAAVAAERRFSHLGPAISNGSDNLLKPLTWQGDMSFAPPKAGRTTFQRLDDNPRWAGIPDLEEAGPRAVESYLRTYGPAAPDHLSYWLGEGLGVGRRRIRSWMSGLGQRLATVDLEGETALLMADDLEDLAATPPSTAVRFLPGHDQWVLGPGTADPHVVPPAHRDIVSRKANLVVVGGVVCGTWTVEDDRVTVAWFPESGPPPERAVTDEVARLGAILGRPLRPAGG